MLILASRPKTIIVPPGEPTTWDRTRTGTGVVLSNGDRTMVMSGGSQYGALSTSTRGPGGKWYVEFSSTYPPFSTCGFALGSIPLNLTNTANQAGATGFQGSNPGRFQPGMATAYFGGEIPAGDWVGLAFDADNQRWWVRNVSQQTPGWSDATSIFNIQLTGGNPVLNIAGFSSGFGANAPFHLLGASSWGGAVTLNPGLSGVGTPPNNFLWWDGN